jgi:transposase InsO family protein
MLRDLARQLDDGRIYDHDLLALAAALNALHEAYNRRPFVRSLTGDSPARARRPPLHPRASSGSG